MDNTSQRANFKIRFQLKNKPPDIPIQLSTAEGCLCYSTDHSDMVLINPSGDFYAGEDTHPWSSSDDVLRRKCPSGEEYSWIKPPDECSRDIKQPFPTNINSPQDTEGLFKFPERLLSVGATCPV